MSQVQSGILPEHCRAAIWIEANVKGEVDALRAASKTFADKLATFEAKFPDAHLGAVVAFGNNTWRALLWFRTTMYLQLRNYSLHAIFLNRSPWLPKKQAVQVT